MIHHYECRELYPSLKTVGVRHGTFDSSKFEDATDCIERFMRDHNATMAMIRTWTGDDQPGIVWDVRQMCDGQARHVGDFLDMPAESDAPSPPADSMARGQDALIRVITGGK